MTDDPLARLREMQAGDLPVHGGRTLAYVYDSGLTRGRPDRPRGRGGVRRLQRPRPDGVPVPADDGERAGRLRLRPARRAGRRGRHGHVGRHRVGAARRAGCPRQPPRRRAPDDGAAVDRARGLPQGRALLRRRGGGGPGRRRLPGRRRGDGGRDRRAHRAGGRAAPVVRARRGRPGARDRRCGGRARGALPRRRLHRRLGAAVRRPAGARRTAVDVRGRGRHVDLGRHPQVRLRPQGHLAAAAPDAGAAAAAVLRVGRVAGLHDAQLDDAVDEVGRAAGRRLGGGAVARRRGLPRA